MKYEAKQKFHYSNSLSEQSIKYLEEEENYGISLEKNMRNNL